MPDSRPGFRLLQNLLEFGRDGSDIGLIKHVAMLAGNLVNLQTPSGEPAPSREDVTMTGDIVRAAAMLGIAVHDHIIVGRDGHASLKGMRLI